jgi:hypothetical protein
MPGRVTEVGDVDSLRNREPNQKDRHEQKAQCHDRGQRWGVQHVEDVARGTIERSLPAPT